VWFHGLLYLRIQSIFWYCKKFICICKGCFEYVLFTFTFNCGVRLSSGESILGGGVCDLSSVSNGSPSERSSPFLGLWKVDKANKFITSRVLHILWNERHLNFFKSRFYISSSMPLISNKLCIVGNAWTVILHDNTNGICKMLWCGSRVELINLCILRY